MSTNIPYLDEVWNVTHGCTKVSAGCANCYAARLSERFPHGGNFGDVLPRESQLDKPLHWRRPRRVGVCFMSDLFHERVPDEFINQVMALIWRTGIPGCWTPKGQKYDPCDCPQEYRRTLPNHTYLILTKRPERMREYFADVERAEKIASAESDGPWAWETSLEDDGGWPIENLWLGVSVENQRTADERIPLLLETPAAHRWVSCEPLLGAVDLTSWLRCQGCGYSYGDRLRHLDHGLCPNPTATLDWVVMGGESGPKARPCDVVWIWDIVRQCVEAGVPVYVKQDSGPRPGMQGRLPDPLWLIKELPKGWTA